MKSQSDHIRSVRERRGSCLIGVCVWLFSKEGLKELLRDRDYEQMNFKEIKGENDALREKLRSFNAQLTEKVEQSQAIMTKQAAEKSVAASSKPRTRSN